MALYQRSLFNNEGEVVMDSWQSYEFSSIAKLSKDKFDPKKEKDNAVCIELEHISKDTGRLIGSTNSDTQLSTKTVFKKGQVLFGKLRPNLKKYIYCAFDGVCSSEIWVLAPQRNIYPKFLFYLVQQEKFIASACIVSGSKMPRADWNYVSNIPFSIPPLSEQKTIADILQTWDTAIEKTEALIAAKEKQFDWLTTLLMNPLKNGWSTSLLKYITRIKKGQQINRDTLDATGDYPVWNGGITPSGYTERYNMNENTITISEGGNSCGFVNISTEKFWLGGHCYALEELNDSIILDFLYFYLKSRERRIMRLRVGSGLPNIQRGDIEKLEIRYPDLREQKRIAETLNTARQEIDIINTLVEQYRTQKRGLMQKLLTGNWRVGL